jgi:ADP-ribosylation factor-like protein 13B
MGHRILTYIYFRLANKQDLPGALDELDLVERLNLEQVVNVYKCPTTVETCAALLSPDPAIQSGFKYVNKFIVVGMLLGFQHSLKI